MKTDTSHHVSHDYFLQSLILSLSCSVKVSEGGKEGIGYSSLLPIFTSLAECEE